MIKFLAHQWVKLEDEELTVGISEDGLDQFDTIEEVNLPEDGEDVFTSNACGTTTSGVDNDVD